MIDSEKLGFKRLIFATFKTYGAGMPDSDTLKIWWNSLMDYNSIQIRSAFNHHTKTNKHTPRISEILDILSKYGRPITIAQRHLPSPPPMTKEQRQAGLKRLRESANALFKSKEIPK